MAVPTVKHETIIKELVAVVGKVKRGDPLVAHSSFEITEDLVSVLSDIKRLIRASDDWANKPVTPSELLTRNAVEFAVIQKLRNDTQDAIDQQAAKVSKKGRHSGK